MAETGCELITGINATDHLRARMLGAKFIRLWDFQAVLTVVSVELTTNQWWRHRSWQRREAGKLSSQ